ncbi:hypothetical protein P7C70_g6262, partial [Phenoliferia sp. Uapishka_3]
MRPTQLYSTDTPIALALKDRVPRAGFLNVIEGSLRADARRLGQGHQLEVNTPDPCHLNFLCTANKCDFQCSWKKLDASNRSKWKCVGLVDHTVPSRGDRSETWVEVDEDPRLMQLLNQFTPYILRPNGHSPPPESSPSPSSSESPRSRAPSINERKPPTTIESFSDIDFDKDNTPSEDEARELSQAQATSNDENYTSEFSFDTSQIRYLSTEDTGMDDLEELQPCDSISAVDATEEGSEENEDGANTSDTSLIITRIPPSIILGSTYQHNSTPDSNYASLFSFFEMHSDETDLDVLVNSTGISPISWLSSQDFNYILLQRSLGDELEYIIRGMEAAGVTLAGRLSFKRVALSYLRERIGE